MPGCQGAEVPGCQGAEVPGGRGAEVPGCQPRSAVREAWPVVAAGALFGVAFLFRYNAGIYAACAAGVLWSWRRFDPGTLVRLGAGFIVPVAMAAIVFGARGALGDLYDATITYNVQYSGETYAGPLDAVRYLLTFPIERARVDALWTLGGAACLA